MKSAPPRRWFQFGLGTVLIALTILACATAVARGIGLTNGAGAAMLLTGYWLALKQRNPGGDPHVFGWVVAAAGILAILFGFLPAAAP